MFYLNPDKKNTLGMKFHRLEEPEITAGGFPTKFQFFRPNAKMIGNFVRTNFRIIK